MLAVVTTSYHYIFQVGDVTTSSSKTYSNTPWYLGMIKGELLLGFIAYCLWVSAARGIKESKAYRVVALTCVAAAILPVAVNGLRVICEGQANVADLRAWLNVWPYLVACLFLPSIVKKEQVEPTLRLFARCCFGVCFGFWLLTVILYFTTGRLPGSSWPGRPRFGGILDDPNGYAALMVLMMALAFSFRDAWWRTRAVLSFVMLIGTQSITGIGLLAITGTVAAAWHVLRKPQALAKVLAVFLLGVTALLALLVTPVGEQMMAAGTHLWEFKRSSAMMHVGYFTEVPEQLQDPAHPMRWIYGASVPPHYETNYRDLSENVYFTVLLGFGLPGMFLLVAAVAIFVSGAARVSQKWSRGVVCWALALSICSIGVPYLGIYPISGLYWSSLALIIFSGVRTMRPSALAANRRAL